MVTFEQFSNASNLFRFPSFMMLKFNNFQQEIVNWKKPEQNSIFVVENIL
jgi:hypothetical protein